MVAGHSTDRESFCTDSCGLKVFRRMASFAEPQILQAFPRLVGCLISEPRLLGIMTV